MNYHSCWIVCWVSHVMKNVGRGEAMAKIVKETIHAKGIDIINQSLTVCDSRRLKMKQIWESFGNDINAVN